MYVMDTASGCFARQARKRSAGQPSASEQPASMIGHDDDLVGVQDLGGLGHEVDAGEEDDVGRRLLGRLRELERVAQEVGEVLDVALLVVVREQDRVALALEALDLVFEVERAREARGPGS